MRSFVTKITGAAAVLAGAAAAQEFRVVGSVYNGVPGEIYTYRTWYGDGNLYVGPHIPASVQTALNFTIPNWSGTAPDVVVGPVPPATVDDLPEGTFFAINNATGATDPVVFTNDASTLGPDYISKWLRYGTFIVPQNPSGASDTKTYFYLQETEQPGTSLVTWRTPGQPTDGLQAINLTAIL